MNSYRAMSGFMLFILFLHCYPDNSVAGERLPRVVQFNRHIRPILTDKCLHCHGPDENSREGDLRLDDDQELILDRGGYHVVVAGKPQKSELYLRLTTQDKEEQMPPVDSEKQLTTEEIKLIRLWIEQGAEYEKHWSFIPPERSVIPKVKKSKWARNGIDAFILARLEAEGLGPSPQATREALLRRVSLDLTGLPPTLAELDAFLADDSPDAYEKVVDRLLHSKRYGEHLARYWLDAARYADTNGFFVDSERSMWRWRNWVIDAFNSNMPFDQFTIEQLAGDLLPDATESQLIASGFNRNHMTTRESGVIDEEYRVEYVVDRVKTMATVWLGMTMDCARCHDHKYDPISQEEFYQLFAFFNSVKETGLKRMYGNSPPLLKVPDSDFIARLKKLREEVATADKEFNKMKPELEASHAKWEKTVLSHLPELPVKGMVEHFNMEKPINMEKPSQAGKPDLQKGLFGNAAQFDGDAALETGSKIDFERTDSFSYGAWMKLTSGSPACLISKNDDVNSLRGFDLMMRKGKAVVHLIHKWNSDAIQVMTKSSITTGRWQHVMVTYDGSGKASGINIYLDGKPQPLDIRYDDLRGTIKTTEPLRIGRRSTSAAFYGMIDEVRIYNRELPAEEVYQLASSQLLRALVSIPAEKRTAKQKETLHKFYITEQAAPKFQTAYSNRNKLRGQLSKLQSSIPTAMVMQELPKPRETFLLLRGQYDEHGNKVNVDVPASMSPMPKEAPKNRLGLAKWLVNRSHPLTARVTVNRFWQHCFGTGIVKTAGDLGSQGEWPSHPDLLDWLAVEFMESGWDVKHLHRLIVTSATYRQTSKVSQAGKSNLLAIDPENRLLARGPRFRLDAEVVRDNALAVSGLLAEQIGGASVKPYQPKGIWKAVSYDGNLTYQQDRGSGLYRRSLYTYWKRQSPPPGMLAFDAPTRETCTVRRPRTNTPLQALTLMNDTTYIEAARVLAQRMMTEPKQTTPQARIIYAFRLAMARLPEPDEVKILLDLYQKQLKEYQQNKQAAASLIAVGESESNPSLDTIKLATWTTTASVILSMDETVSK